MCDRNRSIDGSLTLLLPDGWVESGDLDADEIFRAVLNGRDRDYLPNLAIRCRPLAPGDDLTSEAYWFANVLSLQIDPPPGHDELRKGLFDTPEGTVYWLSYLRAYDEVNLTLTIVQYFIVRAGNKYLVSVFITPFDYDELIESLHGIAASIAFT